ncbi:hypothetical protein BC827DRAFT_195733 [Russula dissimulans]|nr:hypothetical protein BC827DRAFT_195733 [Russula dissimulans]
MADLTMLHAPSTLYLPKVKETGLRFALNHRSLPSRPVATIAIPIVTVEMVDTGSPPPSPIKAQDDNLLLPPRLTRRSKEPLRLTLPRLSSAKAGTVDSPARLFPRAKTPNSACGRRSPIPVVVRPPTTLCACIVP